ncbi:MAG: transposase [Ignavibacteriae bacterium]|nr:transposase [Ignavibacteriota bacterium]
MGRSRYKIFETEYPYFLTCTVVNWLCLFSKPEIVEIVTGSLRFLQEHHRLELYAYVIMEHHLHLIASSDNLSNEIGDFKSYTARSIIEYLKKEHSTFFLQELERNKLPHKKDRTFQLWQEGSHPEMIRDEIMMRQKIEYIHNNPIKCGYVDEQIHWRYSSARNYAGMTGILEVVTEWM